MSKHTSPLSRLALVSLLALGVQGATRGDDGIAQAIDPSQPLGDSPAAVRAQVDRAIDQALALEHQGDVAGALEVLRALVHATNFADAKARYFLAREYRLEARDLEATDPKTAAEDRQLSVEHLRGALADAAKSPLAEDQTWAKDAQQELASFVLSTPLLDQYAEGGSYPYGYCGPTSLRMILRLEGLADPGADAVALKGAAPYTPGVGSSGAQLAARARELGLTGARFSETATLDAIATQIASGRPVMVAGDGWFSATKSDGTTKARSYDSGHWLVVVGVARDASGHVTSVTLNDPDGGTRETMTAAAFKTFFGADGTVWDVTFGL
jgi:hypothetical protein